MRYTLALIAALAALPAHANWYPPRHPFGDTMYTRPLRQRPAQAPWSGEGAYYITLPQAQPWPKPPPLKRPPSLRVRPVNFNPHGLY